MLLACDLRVHACNGAPAADADAATEQQLARIGVRPRISLIGVIAASRPGAEDNGVLDRHRAAMKSPPIVIDAATQRQHRRWTRSALVLAGLSAILALGFFGLSRAVVRGSTGDFDRRVLLAMRTADDVADPIGPQWVEEMGRDVTALGGTAVIVLLTTSVVTFFWLSSMRHAAIYVAVTSVGALLISTGLKGAFDRPRPNVVPHGAYVYMSSFPSGHTTMAATAYLTLGMLASQFVSQRRLKALFIGVGMFVTACVGVSRVYLGVHWPSDVLAGWAVGLCWGLLCWCGGVWLQDRGMLEPEVEAKPTLAGSCGPR